MATEPSKQTKRRVKNPETFRERAIKASETSGQPTRFGRAKTTSGKVVSPITRPVGKAAGTVGRQKPVQLLRKPARIIGKVLLPSYFRNSWKELRLVKWPTWRESLRLTFAVIVFAIAFGATIAVVDYGLDKLFRNILLK